MGATADKSKHPCFNIEAKKTYARVHLPIAPKCNIQCNYCNRKYDCVNESRPGVTSSVLSPLQALEYFNIMTEKIENISVVGIAGPGDPFATPEETIETIRLIRNEHPDMLFCLSTNGINLYDYIDEIAEIGVSHVTITINSLDPERLQKIYPWVRHNKRAFRGKEASEILISEQLRCIPKLKEKGMIVKINTILIPGINDDTLDDLAKKVTELGADIMNCIPMKPVEDTPFENIVEPTKEQMHNAFDTIAQHLAPMKHCARCRADAAGLLGKDHKECHKILKETAMKTVVKTSNKPRVAVASYEGILVNQHLGEAFELLIFEKAEIGYKMIERRKTPKPGAGDERWTELADLLYDCRAVLVGGAGPKPTKILQSKGIQTIQMAGMINTGLDALFQNKDMSKLAKTEFKCGSSCGGNAKGCA